MKLKYFIKSICLFVFLAPYSLINAAPVFIPIDVLLQSSSSAEEKTDSISNNFAGGIGAYQVNTGLEVLAFGIDGASPFPITASTSATFSSTGLKVSGNSDGGRYFRVPDLQEVRFGGSTRATISFTLTESSVIDFQFTSQFEAGSARMVDSKGSIVFDCFYQGECYDTNIFASTNGFISFGSTGSFFLNSGDYSLSVSSFSNNAAGVTSPGNVSLSLSGLTIIPIPAAIWLFGSGLIGLLGVVRIKKNI